MQLPLRADQGESSGADSGSTSHGLLARIRTGEALAWGQLVELYGPLVYGWCRLSGLQAADAADVVQNTFAAVSQHVVEFRRDRPGDSFRNWLWMITRNKIYDHFRSQRVRAQAIGGSDAQHRLLELPERRPEESSSEGSMSALNDIQRRAVALVRAQVEGRTWQAFWYVTVEGRTVAEAAADLGMSVRAVYEAKYRVRRRLRQEYAELIE
jgi:RNA polymerase sigma-70 factor, ECF subfamily